MNNEIEIFKNEELGEVRTLFIDGDCWFVARDIAKCLGYERLDNMYKIIDNEDKKEINPQSTDFAGFLQNGGIQLEPNVNIKRMIIVNESGMYSAIFNSELKTAKKFKRWVTSEVLPSIRKHGMYVTEELLKDKNKLNEQLDILQNEYYKLESEKYYLDFENKALKDEKEVIQKENCKLRTERHMPSVVCIKAKTDESYLPDLALQLVRLYLKEHNNIITRKAEDGIYIKKKPIEKELKKITFTSKERTLLILSIGNIIESTNEIFIKNEYLADDFYLKSTAFLND